MTKIVDIKKQPSVASAATSEIAETTTRDYNRTPWSGNLDETELARPGGLLLAALVRCANDRRLQLNDMARELGVTYGYINQLRNGIRPVSQVSDEFALACARFLGAPRLTVLMLANRITPEDAFEYRELAATEIGRAMAYICEDPAWGHLITAELRKGTSESQYALVRLYEAATGKVLMDSHLNIETLALEIRKLKVIQDQRAKAVSEHSARKRHDA
jgi:transcriptional regulator with XRE-family HTH domain